MQASQMREGRFAAVVLGYGPGGAAASAELARSGVSTLLIGSSNKQRANVGECLPPSIRPQLEKACVWNEFLNAGHTPSFGIRSVWGSSAPAERDFLLSPYGTGWHIDRARFDAMMRESALRCGVQSLECDALRSVERVPGSWRIKLATASGECKVETQMILDATGRSSVFARRTGAKRRSLDRLAGVAGYFSCDRDSAIEPVILIEASEHGWWYSAPLPAGRMIAVFMTDVEFIQRQKLNRSDVWMALLNTTQHQRGRVRQHRLRLDNRIRVVPAESSFLDRIAGEGWLALGDAAAAYDPLSSQGIVAAISSGLDAAQTAVAWVGGNHQAALAYADRARRQYAEYLAHREAYYGIEQRWPESSFWKVRHAPPAALSLEKKAV